jgi:hypothetical protein
MTASGATAAPSPSPCRDNPGHASGIGVYVFQQYNDTIINSGTISGAVYAVQFGNATFGAGINRLIIDLGAVFVGKVTNVQEAGLTINSTLELASGTSSGTLSGLGTKYLNFTSVVVDAGANWVLAGSNTIASGETFTDFGTLTNTGTLTGGGKLVIDPATFANSGYSSVEVALDAGSYQSRSPACPATAASSWPMG